MPLLESFSKFSKLSNYYFPIRRYEFILYKCVKNVHTIQTTPSKKKLAIKTICCYKIWWNLFAIKLTNKWKRLYRLLRGFRNE